MANKPRRPSSRETREKEEKISLGQLERPFRELGKEKLVVQGKGQAKSAYKGGLYD